MTKIFQKITNKLHISLDNRREPPYYTKAAVLVTISFRSVTGGLQAKLADSQWPVLTGGAMRFLFFVAVI